jgi:hypothetical protein
VVAPFHIFTIAEISFGADGADGGAVRITFLCYNGENFCYATGHI